jgi:hypothetical protein
MRNILLVLLSLVLACLHPSAQTIMKKVPAPVAPRTGGAVISPMTPLPDHFKHLLHHHELVHLRVLHDPVFIRHYQSGKIHSTCDR